MEEGAQASDWDSDETMIEGSVMESDLEEEELPWRRLLIDQDTCLGSEFSLHPDTSGICKGTRSPEIQLRFKLREDLQKQISKNKTMPVLGEDTVLQQPQEEMEQNQALLQTGKSPLLTVSFPQAELPVKHQSIQGPMAENPEVFPHPEKELSEDRDSPEISLLSGSAIKVFDMVAVKEKLLTEPQKILAANTFSESEKKVTLSLTSEETRDEESSLETFVSALEQLQTPPKITQEGMFEIMSDFEPGEFMNPLSNSPNSISIPLTCQRALLENTKDDGLPAELLAALNTLSEEVKLGPICHRREGGSGPSTGNECLGIKPNMSQTDEDCTQVAEMNLDSLCTTPPFEQDAKLAELQNKHLSVQQTLEDSNPFGLQTLVDQNVSYDKGNSNPVENSSDQDTPCVLRRSSRIKVGSNTDNMYKMAEKILPKVLGCENQTNDNSSTENFRMQDPVLMIKGKRKNMHSSRLKSGERIRKNRKLARNNEKLKMNTVSLSAINRRNIFGENLLYKAAVWNDIDLVNLCIKKGGNVNQSSYAGWTALHEASVGGFYETASELVKGGADVNIKGMYQVTPLHDAVVNKHYKVAELLLLNGADPLFRSDNGKCALDEAKDAYMKRLLERYIPKHQKHLTSAQENSSDPLDTEDAHQCKKPKFSSENCIGFVCDEKSNRQKPEHVKVDKRSKDGLFLKKEDIYEHYQKDSTNTKFGKFKHKQSTLNQKNATRLRKDIVHNVKNTTSTIVSKYKGRRNTQHKMTQVGNVTQESYPRKTVAVSSSRRINGLVTHQQHTLQTLEDLPEESCEPFGPCLSSLTNGLHNSIEACSAPEKTYTQNLDLSYNQEIKFLELESIDQAKAVSFSGPSLHKEIKLPVIITDEQPHTHQEQQHISPYKSHENNDSSKKKECLNKGGNFNDDHGNCGTSVKTGISKKVISSTGCKKCYNCKENIANREEMDFQQFLSSEDHFSQEDKSKSGNNSKLPQQEAARFSNSDKTAVSEPRIANYEQCIYGTSFDHPLDNPEHISPSYTRTLSTHEVSKFTSHVEQFKRPQDCSLRAPTALMNQTDTHIVRRANKKEGTKRNYTDKGQKPSSSNRPLSTVVHSQVIDTNKVEKRRHCLPESEIIYNEDFYSADNMNKELTDISQLSQREEKEISHQRDEEITNNINRDESTIRNCEEEKEKTDLEIHTPTNIQEHKVHDFRKRQNFLKAASSKETKTSGIDKRKARGKSQLHLAARRGNLFLVKALIKSGADVNLKDNAGWTPLHKASSEGSDDIIIELLNAGAKVNCENLDGILPLHDAVANNHLKAAEILLQHGANPNQKNHKQKTALDEADDEKMRELLKSYGAIESGNRDDGNAVATVKAPTIQSERQSFCDDCKTVTPPSRSYQDSTRESLSVHQTITAILQAIEEKQENLLALEIRAPEDAEQYIKKMLEIKDVIDNVLAKQKAERDDLAKKYRVSVESFKHGVLREQLANLASRQKSLLVVAKKQKTISQKIQNYKNVTSLSDLSMRKLPSSSQISSEKHSQEFTSQGKSAQPQSGSLSPVNIVCGSTQETQLSLETWNNSQNTITCLNSETMRGEEFSGNELNSKQNVNGGNLDESSKSRPSDGTKTINLPSQPVAFIAEAEYSQKENDFTETTARGHEFYSPSALTGTSSSESSSVLAQNDAHPSTVISDQALSNYDPKRGNRKTASQQPPRGALETLTQQGINDLGSDSEHQMKPYLKKSAFAAPHANDGWSSTSGSGCQHNAKKCLNYSTASKKKCMQIKDLIALGRINPGNNILEFKTQETIHKASVLLSGKIKVENGQIYQNPVTWLKDLLGGDSYVTWNYAWSKVTYLGKELLKYVPEEVPIPPEPNLVPQQHQSCLPGASRDSMQSIPHYLQINEILLVSDQEFLPCHIMDQHWKFYVECEELTF